MKRKKEKKLKVVWKQTEGISKEEAKRRLDGAFDILFRETYKKWKRNKKLFPTERLL